MLMECFALQDCTIRSCDFDAEQTCVLHSPEKKMERISSDAEVHMALTPLQPVVFFGFHKRMSVTGLFNSEEIIKRIVLVQWSCTMVIVHLFSCYIDSWDDKGLVTGNVIY